MIQLRSLMIAVAIVTAVYALSGCSQSTTNTVTVHDTVAVHDTLPDWDDSTWIIRPAGTSSDFITLQFVDSALGYAAGVGGTVVRTTDGGLSWTSLTPAPTSGNSSGNNACYGIWFFNKKTGIAIGEANGVLHTTDSGASWYGTTIGTPYFLRSLYFTSPTTGFIGTADPLTAGAAGEIWKTTDAGVTWQRVATTPGGIFTIRFGSAANGVALGKVGTAYWTSDGGSSWHAGSTDGTIDQINSCAFTNSTTAFAVTVPSMTGGAILKTTDAGVTWNTVKALNYGGGGIAYNGKGVLTVTGYYGGITESSDGGATWADDHFGTRRWEAIAYLTPSRSVIAGENGQIASRHREF